MPYTPTEWDGLNPELKELFLKTICAGNANLHKEIPEIRGILMDAENS